MAQTFHAASADRVAVEWMKTAEGRKKIAMAEEWRHKSENADLLAVFGDPWGGWTMGQLVALCHLGVHVVRGRFKIAHVEVGHTPFVDRAYAENQKALDNLPHGIKAEVYQGPSGGAGLPDGIVSIPDGLWIIEHNGQRTKAEFGWGGIPLEIGRTDASRTFSHMAFEGAVARWPYGYDKLFIMTTEPRYWLGDSLAQAYEPPEQPEQAALMQPALF